MTLLTFDTETTALRPGQICQLAYILDDGSSVTGANMYFAVDEMSESSFNVHGLSLEKLNELSDGRRFSDRAFELSKLFASADVVCGHNVAADLRFLQAEFERAGMTLPKFRTFCTMNSFTKVMMLKRRWPAGHYKPPKLVELAEYLGVTFVSAEMFCKGCFGGGETMHDARFDTALTYLCIQEGLKQEMITI